jgi:hypothetical protein
MVNSNYQAFTLGPARPGYVPLLPQVFLSHSSADADLVEWIAAQVQAVGLHPYLAERDIQPGKPLADKVREAIAGSAALLVLLTDSGASSRYVQQEIGAAVQSGRPVIALVEHTVVQEPLAMLDGIEHIRIDRGDLATMSASLTTALLGIVSPRVQTLAGAYVSSPRPILAASFHAELNLTPGQLFVGMFIVLLVVGCVYVATHQPSPAPEGSCEQPPY